MTLRDAKWRDESGMQPRLQCETHFIYSLKKTEHEEWLFWGHT